MLMLMEFIRGHAIERGDKVAIEDETMSINYARFEQEAAKVAQILRDAGLQCVAIVGDNSIAWAIADLACLSAGVCSIPLPAFFSASQLQHLCRSAGVEAYLGEPATVEKLAQGRETRQCMENLLLADMREGPGDEDHPLKGVAKVTFTSGSTGMPKGVCLTTTQIDHTLLALNEVVVPGTSHKHPAVLPLVTLLENIAGLYLGLMQGATIMLRPMQQIGFTGLASLNAQDFFEVLQQTRAQSLILVPELLRILMQGVTAGMVDCHDFRLIAVGGGKVSEALLRQAGQLGLPVVQGYGMSECASVIALNALHNNRPGSVGKPMSHVEVSIAGDGEILIRGNTMRGYLGEPAIGADWLHSGDLGYLDDDGYLYVTGRKKNLLITAFGKNISPEWVESEFMRSPAIRQILVNGDANNKLSAIVVPSAQVSDEALCNEIETINETLPEYARIADYQVASSPFNYENGLLTANGRLKRDAIIAYYA